MRYQVIRVATLDVSGNVTMSFGLLDTSTNLVAAKGLTQAQATTAANAANTNNVYIVQ